MPCCSFVPAAFFERLAQDESLSDEAREAAQANADAISQTMSALETAADPSNSFTIRHDKVPSGFADFSCKIWGMAAATFENKDTTSYKPLPGIFYAGSDDPPYTQDADVVACMDGFRTVYDFYRTVFGRNSIDGQGLQLEASIHYQLRYGNAFWEPRVRQMVIGDGDGATRFGVKKGFLKPGSLAASLDVLAHEVTHGVTQFTAGLRYRGESGALNESMSDVFACMVVQWKKGQQVQDADWLVGADIVYAGSDFLKASQAGAVNMRSLKAPADPTNLFPQPDSVISDLWWDPQDVKRDHGGVHQNSGVPNHAFYKAAMALGGHSWERAGRVWYATLTGGELQRDATFIDFASLTVKNAQSLFPEDASVATAIHQAWQDVMVLAK